MSANNEIEQIVEDIYTEMYVNAEPSANYQRLKQKAPLDPPIYKRHYLDIDTQEEIIQNHLDNSDLSERERDKVRFNVNLGAAPITSKDGRTEAEYD